jgi:hypothetical protein
MGAAHAAADMHTIFSSIGADLQHNLVCQNGQPIHLADMPMDPDVYQFWKTHRAQAHDWAMEGVREAQTYAIKCGDRSQIAEVPVVTEAVPAPVAQAGTNYHDFFYGLGVGMQQNLVCHDGLPISLDAMEAGTGYDPDVWRFRHAHPDLAHKWAMEGVNSYVANHGDQCRLGPAASDE